MPVAAPEPEEPEDDPELDPELDDPDEELLLPPAEGAAGAPPAGAAPLEGEAEPPDEPPEEAPEEPPEELPEALA